LSLDLDQRRGWPAELRILLDRHPRDTWPAQRSVDHFRHDCIELETLASDYRDGRKAARELAVIAGSRLRTLVANLHGHHRVEDFHYFPAYRAADPRLAAGFDVLERDHGELHRDVVATLSGMQQLHTALAQPPTASANETVALAARHYVTAANRLCSRLIRHLSDEEDLVIPLLLERGDY
jgi:Hemerythrin HHE cation binding domain